MFTHQDMYTSNGNPAAFSKSIGVRATAATIAACVGLMAAATIASPATAQDDDIRGLWVAADGKTIVEVDNCEQKKSRICGTVVFQDGSNIDGEVGMELLKNFKGANVQNMRRWEAGKVAKLDGGKAKKGNIVLLEDGDLKITSCARGRCSNETWNRPSAAMAQKAASVSGGQ